MRTRLQTIVLSAVTLLVFASSGQAQRAAPTQERTRPSTKIPTPFKDPDAVSVARSEAAIPAAPLPGAPNDHCVDALMVGIPSVTSGTTLGATDDPEAGPACGTPIDVGGVWYKVVGTGNTITATTCPFDDVQPGSANYNSKLSVFCGTCGALSCIDGNDNGCSFFAQSTVDWCSEDGVEYWVLVHGADGEQGNFEISIYDDGVPCFAPPDCTPAPTGACCFDDGSCVDATVVACGALGGVHVGDGTECASFDCSGLTPENDTCNGAVPVAVPSLTDGSTIFATGDDVEFCTVWVGDTPGVWYEVVGTGNTITATTCNGDPVQPGDADYDTVLKVYCGACNTSNCCVGSFDPGCDDDGCEEIVCSIDPFCCDGWWDDICADQAAILCEDLCLPSFCVTDNDDACSVGFLQSTVRWCTEPGRTYFVFVTGNFDTGNFTLSVYDDGTPCQDPPICEPCAFQCAPGSTLEDEPNCGIPEDIVNGGCNSPIGGTSDCCTAHAEPGCNDSDCTDIVCAIDPFCCAETWDAVCAQLAIENCGSCADIIYPMEPISCGETYCSTAGGSGAMRDVDWYKLQVPEDSLVELTATCGFSPLFGIVDNFGIDSCEGLSDWVSYAIGQPCVPTTVSAFLPAGTWYIILAPSNFNVLECETEYELTVTCSQPGACCYGNNLCYQRDETVCIAEGGTYFGPGSSCFVDLDGEPASYTSEPNVAIPDGNPNGVVDRITVDESIAIGKITVDLTIIHTWIEDLVIELIHEPSQTSAVLWRATCPGAQDLDATFDDDGDPVTCWVPTTGVIAPLEVNGNPLFAFQGLDAAGEWALRVTDIGQPDFGRLESWTLNIETGTEVHCPPAMGRCCPGCPSDCGMSDGVVDTLDLIVLLEQWGLPGTCAADGVVDYDDLLRLLSTWGPCPTGCSVTTFSQCDQAGGDWLPGADCASDPCDP